MNREETLRAIRNSSYSRYADTIDKMLRMSIRLRATRCDARELAIGETRLAGPPDMPADEPWPVSLNGAPLTFLAQLHLRDIALADEDRLLPADGHLCFFYDVRNQPWGIHLRDYGGWHVKYLAPDRTLTRREHAGTAQFAPCKVVPELQPTLPTSPETGYPGLVCPFEFGAAEFSEPTPRREALADAETFAREFPQIALLRAGGDYEHVPMHRALGHPQEVQDEMPGGFRSLTFRDSGAAPDGLVRILSEERDWRLLLQLDSDEVGPGWSWGDEGRLYFWMPTSSIRARRFEDVWLCLQCY